MGSTKCAGCGLPNFSYDDVCRRCGSSLVSRSNNMTGARPRRFSVSSLVVAALIAGLGYYVYNDLQKSMDEVNANEAKRIAEQEKDKTAGMSRSEYQKHRSGAYGSAIRNSNSLAAHGEHVRQTEALMQTAANGQQGTQ